jgi:phosphatidylglycerol---prolipoprotein diacylglyceryl transferase
MITLPAAPWAHYLGDIAAWICAATAARWQHRRWPDQSAKLARVTRPSYFISLALGGLAGAWLFGSINSLRAVVAAPSHSIAGALAGAILAVELWKWQHGIRQSTGGAFVFPICVGIAVGRLGCLFAGTVDYTFGMPTALPWGMDMGDGISRHPVSLYESLAMAAFAVGYARARIRGADWVVNHGFHAMILFYSVQRFAWEFLKPYPSLVGPLNIFHLLTVGLFIYALFWWRRGQPRSAA